VAATNRKMQEELGPGFCDPLHSFFKEFQVYPSSLDDPRLPQFMPGSQSPESLAGSLGFTLTYAVTPGTPGDESSWNFDLCATKTTSALAFCTGKTCPETTILAAGATPGTGGEATAAGLATAAEMITPLLLAQPEAISAVRPYLMQAGITDKVFELLDSNGDGVLTLDEMLKNTYISPFARFLRTPGFFGPAIDAQVALTKSDLAGDPPLLFYYDSLRALSEFYVLKKVSLTRWPPSWTPPRTRNGEVIRRPSQGRCKPLQTKSARRLVKRSR
jgi:hypothetical protein